jgi:hypothetical protein
MQCERRSSSRTFAPVAVDHVNLAVGQGRSEPVLLQVREGKGDEFGDVLDADDLALRAALGDEVMEHGGDIADKDSRGHLHGCRATHPEPEPTSSTRAPGFKYGRRFSAACAC